MKKYLGVKLIEAEPSLRECGCDRSKEDESICKCQEEGYKVIYEDGYESWSPKDVFKESYRRIDNLTFGLAIEALKKGHIVNRVGWDSDSFVFLENNAPSMQPYLVVNNINGCYPFNPGADSILAEDWQIIK